MNGKALFSLPHLRAVMEAAGCEGLLATSPANFRFLTNIASRKLALLPGLRVGALYAEESVTAIVPAAMLMDVAASGHSADRVVVYGNWPNFAPDAVSRDVAERRTRALFDETYSDWHPDFDTALASVLTGAPGRIVADAAGFGAALDPAVFGASRRIKSASFVSSLRDSLRRLESAVAGVVETIVPGQSMLDLTRAFAAEFARRDAWSWVGSIQIGPAGSLAVAPDDSVRVRPGDLVRWDLAASFDGIWADSARTLSIGSPGEESGRAFESIEAGHRAALAAAKPGMLASELFAITIEATRRAGLPAYDAAHTGHAIGIDLYETPLIADGQAGDIVLAPGMVLCLENPWFAAGLGTVAEEDMVLVTQDGIEILNTTPSGLVQL